MPGAKRLGISPHLYGAPLAYALHNEDAFELVIDGMTNNAIQLREQKFDAAFLTPIDYARESSLYTILPGIAVSSEQASETIVLHFRHGIHTIARLAVDPSSTSEIVLATILLAEQFNARPKLVPVIGTLNDMLEKADAALLVGDAALRESGSRRNWLDLVEVWNELTDLPYVHGIWCCREGDLTADHVSRIRSSRDQGMSAFVEIGTELSTVFRGLLSPKKIAEYLQSFSYDFAESTQEGMKEFLRYAYYHGILPDVADLHFYGIKKDPEESDISLN